MTLPATIKYAVYPGTVTLYNGEEVTLTAEELAELWGVQDEDYLVVEEGDDEPQGMSYFEYIHLKPRADGRYPNAKTNTQDDDQAITWERDFDGDKQYIQETDPNYIDKDVDMPHN